jgi:hypothetical protein
MIPAIIEHGADVFNNAGIKLLGYPGLWSHTNSEVRKIEQYLKGEE